MRSVESPVTHPSWVALSWSTCPSDHWIQARTELQWGFTVIASVRRIRWEPLKGCFCVLRNIFRCTNKYCGTGVSSPCSLIEKEKKIILTNLSQFERKSHRLMFNISFIYRSDQGRTIQEHRKEVASKFVYCFNYSHLNSSGNHSVERHEGVAFQGRGIPE